MRAPKVCAVAGCPEPALAGRTACARHRRVGGGRWRKLRARRLAVDGRRCVICGAPATTVNHRTPIVLGGRELVDVRELDSRCDRHTVRGRYQERER